MGVDSSYPRAFDVPRRSLPPLTAVDTLKKLFVSDFSSCFQHCRNLVNRTQGLRKWICLTFLFCYPTPSDLEDSLPWDHHGVTFSVVVLYLYSMIEAMGFEGTHAISEGPSWHAFQLRGLGHRARHGKARKTPQLTSTDR